MASMKLTEGMRHNIKEALLARAFGEREAALDALEKALANDIYHHLYPAPIRKKMAALPPGFLPTDTDHRIKFAGDFHRMDWGDSRRVAAELRSNASVFDANHPFTDRFRDIKNQREKLEKEKREASAKARAALKAATTTNRLLQAWPEVEPFLEPYRRKSAPAPLPVVQTEVLNKTFGLPVEAKAKPQGKLVSKADLAKLRFDRTKKKARRA